jgi:hypothetical protein
MKIHQVLVVTLLAGVTHAADTKTEPSNAAVLFKQLKTLVGEWESPTDKSKITFELTGAGTTLIEKYSSARHVTMHSMYHLDGDRLVMTHYCMAGNQPRMVAGPFDAKTGEVAFKLLDITNLAKPGAGHMNNAKYKFIDADHFQTVWVFVENDKPKFTEDVSYTRVR